MSQDNLGNSDQKTGNVESNKGRGGDKVEDLASGALGFAEKNPQLAGRATDLANKFAGAQANGLQAQANGPQDQEQEPNQKKPLEKEISTQSKVMMGVGALMLMLVLGPMIFPAIAGMGAMGTALMAGAGVGLLASGIKKAMDEKESPQPTSARSNNRIAPVGNSMASQGNDLSDLRQAMQQQGSQAGRGQQSDGAGQEQAGQASDMEKALQEAKTSGAVDGVKDDKKLISEVDEERGKLMDKLALPENLKTMVKNNSTEMENFKNGFEKHLKDSFFVNMGEWANKKGTDFGMGEKFLKELKEEDSDSKTAFNEFKENMLALLKKDNAHHHQGSQSHEALVAEKEALKTASQKIEGLKAGNKEIKEQLDKTGYISVDSKEKEKADKTRLESLKEANKKISSAKEVFESKKPAATPAPAKAPEAPAPAPAAPARGV